MIRHRLFLFFMSLMLLAFPLVPDSAAADGQETYVSTDLGFSLGWDDPWSLVDQRADLLSESITLSNDTSTVTFRALLGFGGDSDACLDYVEVEFRDATDFDISSEISGGLTEPLSGDSSSASFSIYRVNAQDGGRGSSLIYLDCQTLIPGESVLVGKIVTPGSRWLMERRELRDLWRSVKVIQAHLPEKSGAVSPLVRLSEWFGNDIDAFWSAEFEDAELTFKPPTYRVFDEPIPSGCGELTAGTAALYCGFDAGVYLDERWISLHVLPDYGITGVAYLMAHETAHSVQIQRNILIASRRQELQADCLAGGYLKTRVERGGLSESSVAHLASLIRYGGDDAISNLIGTNAYLESHGTGQQRLTLFRRGYEAGIEACGLELTADE